MRNLHIDFETFSECDIKKSGGIHYAMHPSTEILLVSWAIDDGPVQVWAPIMTRSFDDFTIYGLDTPDELLHALGAPEFLVWAHRALFERAIITYVAARQLNWPTIASDRYRCTQILGLSLALPAALENLAPALRLEHTKDKEGKRLIDKFSKMQKGTKKIRPHRIFPEDDVLDFSLFSSYCLQDTVVEREVHRTLEPYLLRPAEQRLFVLDQDMAFRGFQTDQYGIGQAIKVVDDYTERSRGEFGILTGGLKPTQREKFKVWCASRGCQLPNTQATTVDIKIADPETPDDVKEASVLCKRVGKAAVKKLYPMRDTCSPDGRIFATLQMFGATTGRWAGRRIQPQNFARPTLKRTEEITLPVVNTGSLEAVEMLYDDPIEAVSSCMRHYTVAAPGKTLYVADFAAIEARVVCWLAGQQDALDMFAAGVDIYIDMAAKSIYFVDPASISKEDVERQVGKGVVLGCGFGMGWERFQSDMWEKQDIRLTEEEAKQAVNGYRKRFKKVVKFWYNLNQACMDAVKLRKRQRVGKLKIYVKGIFLFVELPSGRRIAYPYPKVEMVKDKWDRVKDTLLYYSQIKKGVWRHATTYGGELAENVTQAVAMDCMGTGFVHVEDAGFEPVLTIHDEGVCEQDEDFATIEEYENLMCEMPAWADGLPIKAEGYKSKVYRK